MGAPFYIDQKTPAATGNGRAGSCYLNVVSGVNHSGAEAYLQIYDLGAEPTAEEPLYSYPAADVGTVSQALPGPDARIAGRLLALGCWVGWSSAAASWVPVSGTFNAAGQAR